MYQNLLFAIIPIILSLYAQYKVSSTFKKYNNVRSKKGYTGADVARQLLSASGINDVEVEGVRGSLTDHYDPAKKVVRLSESVYNSTSLAALGVAAHETGHAVQHNTGYIPLNLRSGVFPAVNIGSKLAMPLIIFGMALSYADFGWTMLYAGIILYSIVVLFQIITLPVEFNASRRAISMLEDNNFITREESAPTKKVLNAAAFTYVAAAITAVMYLIRYILLANNRRR